jgi:hypothetical protein
MPSLSGKERQVWSQYTKEMTKTEQEYLQTTDPLLARCREALVSVGQEERASEAWRLIDEAAYKRYLDQKKAMGEVIRYIKSRSPK